MVGKTYFSDANGNVNEGTVFNLKNVNFGGIELKNVKPRWSGTRRLPYSSASPSSSSWAASRLTTRSGCSR